MGAENIFISGFKVERDSFYRDSQQAVNQRPKVST